MRAEKTRCGQCVSKNKSTSQEPCCKCAEIQWKHLSYENHFLDASKDLVKEN